MDKFRVLLLDHDEHLDADEYPDGIADERYKAPLHPTKQQSKDTVSIIDADQQIQIGKNRQKSSQLLKRMGNRTGIRNAQLFFHLPLHIVKHPLRILCKSGCTCCL